MSKTSAVPQSQTILLTMADLAARFSLPESTARYYCRRFDAFLPQKGKGRRKYTSEAIPVFAAIQEAMRRTRHARSVEMELSLQFSAQPSAVKGTSSAISVPSAHDYNPASAMQEFNRGILQVMNAQTLALERIADALAGAGQIAPATAQTAEASFRTAGAAADRPNTEIEAIRKEMKILRGLMDSSEQIHQHDVEQLRKWLNRLGAGQGGQNDTGE